MVYICQQGARHKPECVFWTGEHWGPVKKLYADVELACADARVAARYAVRPTLVMDGHSVILRLKPPRSRV
jgi:hypothetical protein